MQPGSVLVRSLLVIGCVIGLMRANVVAQASGTQTNKEFIRDLFYLGVIDSQESPAFVNQIASESADAIAKLVAVALSSAPTPSSSAGFTYVRDTATGELSLKSQSFGPTFAERPLTNGRGVWSAGANYEYARTTFEGGFGTADRRDVGLPIFDNTATYAKDGFVQFVTRRAFLESRMQTFKFTASYGVTDRLDIGVIVPLVSLTLDGSTGDSYDLTRQWNAGELTLPAPVAIRTLSSATSRSTTGLGDLALRLKYSLAGQRNGLAVAADVRLPTGSADALLGTGETSVKMLLLLSKSVSGPASLYANTGYTAGGLSDEINYVAGADAALLSNKQLTASASFLGRTLRSGATPSRVPTVRRTVDTGSTGPRDIVVDRFIWSEEGLTLLQAAAGFKLLLGGQWLLDASVIFPLNERGFQPRISPAVGLERTWGR